MPPSARLRFYFGLLPWFRELLSISAVLLPFVAPPLEFSVLPHPIPGTRKKRKITQPFFLDWNWESLSDVSHVFFTSHSLFAVHEEEMKAHALAEIDPFSLSLAGWCLVQ